MMKGGYKFCLKWDKIYQWALLLRNFAYPIITYKSRTIEIFCFMD